MAFTRFQTRYFQGKYGNLDATVISYGPCQTPTLNFCVERHQAIVAFQPEPFWVVRPLVSRAGEKLELEWERGRMFDQDVAGLYLQVGGCKGGGEQVATKWERVGGRGIGRPVLAGETPPPLSYGGSGWGLQLRCSWRERALLAFNQHLRRIADQQAPPGGCVQSCQAAS